MDKAGKETAVDKDGKPLADENGQAILGKDGKPITVKEAYRDLNLRDQLGAVNVDGQKIDYGVRQSLWGSGGTGNILATAVVGAFSGNVTGGASELIKNTAINVVRAYGATEIKAIADAFKNPDGSTNGTSETVRGLLHAIAGCAGASATGGDCASAAVASGGTVAMNNAMGALLNLDPSTMTEEQKQAYSNLMGTLVSGVTSAVGGDTAAAQLAAKIEEDNNWLNYSDSKTKAFTKSALNNADSIAEAEALSGRLTPLDIKDTDQTNNLVKACEDRASNSCKTELQKAWNAYISYSGGLTNNSVINAEKAELRKLLSNYINVSLAEQKTLGFAFNIAVTQEVARAEVGKGIAGRGGDKEPSKVVRDIKTVLENPDKLTAGQYAQAGVKGSVNSVALEPLSMGAEASKADIATRTGLGSVLTDWVFGTDSSEKTNQEMQDILNNRPDFTLKGENSTAQAVIDTSGFATGIATMVIAPERLLALKNISVTRPLTNAEKLELKAAGIDAGFFRDTNIIPNTTYDMMKSAEQAGWKHPNGSIWYPPDNGAVKGTQHQIVLPIGTKLDRYGEIGANTDFLAEAGTPLAQRALPPGSENRPLVRLEVMKPLPVEQSNIMPWFGQPGMGKQFQTTTGSTGMTVQDLIREGYLRVIK